MNLRERAKSGYLGLYFPRRRRVEYSEKRAAEALPNFSAYAAWLDYLMLRGRVDARGLKLRLRNRLISEAEYRDLKARR